jgi:prepilin-type N-terminal cleavage/methylation domain-containing protein
MIIFKVLSPYKRPSSKVKSQGFPLGFPPIGSSLGFSFIEMLTVMIVIGILAAVAYPAVSRLYSGQQLSRDSHGLDELLQKARLRAAITQRPIRVVLDCSKDRCWAELQAPVYDKSNVVSWDKTKDARKYLSERTAVTNVQDFSDHDGTKEAPKGVRYAIFLPDSRVFSDPKPFDILIHPAKENSIRLRKGFRVLVSADSGRVLIRRESISF